MHLFLLLATWTIVGQAALEQYIAALGGSSLLDTHLATTSKKKRKDKFVDLDCDSVSSNSDVIEDTCHEYRYRMLLAVGPTVQKLMNNRSEIMSKLADLNVTTIGSGMQEGLFQKIEFQREALYSGIPEKSVPALVKQAHSITGNVFKLFDFTNAVYDTEWSNFFTTTEALAEYIADFNIGDFVRQLNTGMLLAQGSQAKMSDFFQQRMRNMLQSGNDFLAENTMFINNFQQGFAPDIVALSGTAKAVYQKQIASAQLASDKLEDTTDYLATAPNSYRDAIGQYKEESLAAIKAGREAFLANATSVSMASTNKDWNRQNSMFDKASIESLSQEAKAWNQAESVRLGDFSSAFQRATRTNSDALSSTKLSDAQDIGEMNEMVNNMTDNSNAFVYQAHAIVTKSDQKLKQLQSRAAAANVDVGAEFGKLLTSLSDSTVDQQSKISNFLKLAADSDAKQLAALVQSASAMRSSLADNQAGARADLDLLIASLQTKLANKAQSEGNVSVDVQQALSIGSAASEARIKAAQDYQAMLNAQALSGMNDSAGDALDAVMETAMAGATSIANLSGDMQNVASTSRKFVADQSALTDAQTKQAIATLHNLAISQAGSNLKSSGDASAAARDILSSLLSVKTGGTSLSSALASREGSMSGKLSAIAAQLGMSDDAAAAMYEKLLKNIAASADSQVQGTLTSQLAASNSVASKLGTTVHGSKADLDATEVETEIAQKRAMEVDAQFKAKINGVAQSLDAQFASRLERDSAIRSAVGDGLAATKSKLVIDATKAVNSVDAVRQAYSDAARLQFDKDLASFQQDVSKQSQSEFQKAQAIMTQLSAYADTRRESATDLTKATNGYKSYIDEANRRISVQSNILDTEDKFFSSNMSSIWGQGSAQVANLTQIDAYKSDLVAFMKSVPQKLSREIKTVEDAFLLTDSQIAMKARMLQSMASSEMSDLQRAAVNSELANLGKSESLMNNFKEIQRQALNEVFAKNSGLLGVAGGTIGNLTDVANSISKMLNSNDKLNGHIDNVFGATSAAAKDMTGEMMNAVDGTQDALGRSIRDAASQGGFSSNITNAQVGALVQSANRDGNLASDVAADVGNVSEQTILEKQQRLAGYAKMLENNQAELTNQVSHVMRTADTTDADLQRRVENDVAEKASQLLIVKNAVEQLLQTWSQYTGAQQRKFTRWNSTEDEYVGQFQGSLSSMNQSALTEVTKTSHAINVDQTLSSQAISDLVGFENKMDATQTQVRDAVVALNTSSSASIAQVGEQIYNQDLSDSTYDEKARQTALDDVQEATNTVDAQMEEILDSLNVGIQR